MRDLLLDTCAVIWSGLAEPLAPEAMQAIDACHREGRMVQCSPFTAWELGALVARNRLLLTQSPAKWFHQFVRAGGVKLAELSVDILAGSSFLPGTPPRDPADRIIIATAREYGLCIVTRDRAILEYAHQGHVMALRC